MSDTYATIALIANTAPFLERVKGCAAQQDPTIDPNAFAAQRRYQVAAAPGWGAKVDSWLAANPGGGDGWAEDQAVISDSDILAVVQPMLTAPGPAGV